MKTFFLLRHIKKKQGFTLVEMVAMSLLLIAGIALGLDIGILVFASDACDRACKDCARAAGTGRTPGQAIDAMNAVLAKHISSLNPMMMSNLTAQLMVYEDYSTGTPSSTSAGYAFPWPVTTTGSTTPGNTNNSSSGGVPGAASPVTVWLSNSYSSSRCSPGPYVIARTTMTATVPAPIFFFGAKLSSNQIQVSSVYSYPLINTSSTIQVATSPILTNPYAADASSTNSTNSTANSTNNSTNVNATNNTTNNSTSTDQGAGTSNTSTNSTNNETNSDSTSTNTTGNSSISTTANANSTATNADSTNSTTNGSTTTDQGSGTSSTATSTNSNSTGNTSANSTNTTNDSTNNSTNSTNTNSTNNTNTNSNSTNSSTTNANSTNSNTTDNNSTSTHTAANASSTGTPQDGGNNNSSGGNTTSQGSGTPDNVMGATNETGSHG